MVDSQFVGFALALLSLLMTAIFPIFGKIKRVASTNINPMIFNIYFLCGVILFCIIVTVITQIFHMGELYFTYMGVISGVLLGIGGWLLWL